MAQTRDWKELLAMSAQAGIGKWESNSKLDFLEGRQVVIHAQRRKLLVSVDGELIHLSTPLKARILPGSLRVLCPVSENGAPGLKKVPGGETFPSPIRYVVR
jgi:diacylglycerol kinase family enzyme